MSDEMTIWDLLAEPLNPGDIKTKHYDTKRGDTLNISYIDMQTALDRLNAVCPGDWQFTADVISSPQEGASGQWVVRGTLVIAGVSRTDFGINDNLESYDPPKAALSDAFKRCARQFGIGGELYRKDTPAPRKASTSAPKPITADRPYSPRALAERLNGIVNAQLAAQPETEQPLPDDDAQEVAIFMKRVLPSDDARHAFLFAVFGVNSSKALMIAERDAVKKWIGSGSAVTTAKREADDLLASLGADGKLVSEA
jgi:Rad52/22 family double-strand break repair protein